MLKAHFGLVLQLGKLRSQDQYSPNRSDEPYEKKRLRNDAMLRKETWTVYNNSTIKRINNRRSNNGTMFVVSDRANKFWTKLFPLLIKSAIALPANKTPRPR